MAEVFRAVMVGPENFQRTLVIKRILPHLSQDSAFLQMFIDEAKVSALLSHPNLVQIFDFGKIEESFYIAMEYVHGCTLAATQRRKARVGRTTPPAAAAEIGRQLCEGLDYAHSLRSANGEHLGIVHRDISPTNLMLGFHGAVKILDFGIARVAEGLRQAHTEVGARKGKTPYMSPEQIQGHVVDHRSDIFSLGVVLHELLSGRRLFRANSVLEASRMVLELPIPPPSKHNPEIPAELDRVVMRALDRDVDARYATAGEMAADLERVMSNAAMSPREHVRLLHELFPREESASTTDTKLVVFPPARHRTPRIAVTVEAERAALEEDTTLRRESATSIERPMENLTRVLGPVWSVDRSTHRRNIVIAGLSILALATAATAIPSSPADTERRSRATMLGEHMANLARSGAQDRESVRYSLDSTPSDATVMLADSGTEIGRTPLMITTPRSSEPVAFRFERPGYRTNVYRILPDLDKAIHVDLSPVEMATPAAPAMPRRRRQKEHLSQRTATGHPRSERSATQTRSRSGWVDPTNDVGRATPVNPFSM
jgi:serine/threonine protein kinase